MKLLLTSAGVKNSSINDALLELLGKPIAECSALCISTSSYAIPNGMLRAWEYFQGTATTPMTELGWKSMGVLELTALPSIGRELWVPTVQETDVILVNGGDPMYLAYWMRHSGFADLLPSYNGVYVSLSAGSMIMAPRIGEWFVGWTPPAGFEDSFGRDETLGLVDFSMFPHLDHVMLPYNTVAHAEKWATNEIGGPSYTIDDETAIQVVDGAVKVVSEGNWNKLS